MKKYLLLISLLINKIHSEIIILKNESGQKIYYFYCYAKQVPDSSHERWDAEISWNGFILLNGEPIVLENGKQVEIDIDIEKISDCPIKMIIIQQNKENQERFYKEKEDYLRLFVKTKFYWGYVVEKEKITPYYKNAKDDIKEFTITKNFKGNLKGNLKVKEKNSCSCIIL